MGGEEAHPYGTAPRHTLTKNGSWRRLRALSKQGFLQDFAERGISLRD